MILAKTIADCIDSIEGKIDPAIEPLVILMRESGFNTISSCEGHFRLDSFKHAKPNIIFNALDRGLLHGWIRQCSKKKGPDDLLSFGMAMFPVYNPDADVVHEDNWTVELDASDCQSVEEAEMRRDKTIHYLISALLSALETRPLAVDSFVRSRW